ncbi:recombinase family protein [Rhodococcus sp. NPDC077669]|uniref:recombinase family protein n=1 Tax=Rhodococcus sp. NPDC077669 TaxID=3155174 RepID=UPI003418C76A
MGYARVSTSAQEKGHGLGAQSDAMRKHCQANELQLLTVTYDVMSSGSVPKLFGRHTAIAAIESGFADGLLVRALDRAAWTSSMLLQSPSAPIRMAGRCLTATGLSPAMRASACSSTFE